MRSWLYIFKTTSIARFREINKTCLSNIISFRFHLFGARFDLLSEADVAQQSGELLIREDSGGRVVVKGLNHMLVHDEQEALQVMQSQLCLQMFSPRLH